MGATLEIIEPEWPAPETVRALVTTRAGGTSRAAYAGLNLAEHVGDDPRAVAENRRMLRESLVLPEEPSWLEQVHGREIVRLGGTPTRPPGPADAAVTTTPGKICALLTADCVPILMCRRDGSRVAAAHGGWRGLHAGIVSATVKALAVPPDEVLAWLGPAIGAEAYEVGEDLRERFISLSSELGRHFEQTAERSWCADLPAIATWMLEQNGVRTVYNSAVCTSTDQRFYSYRREGTTGRFASLIWRV